MPQSFAEHLKAFPLSPNLGQSLERAHGFAREQAHRLVTLEHLLLALTEDPEAVIIMQAAGVDLARLTTDVSGHLGRLLEDMRAEPGVEPRPDPELLRVLQAAATAALQSKRRQIDGAIVLAAIVGDGKSPAAGMLKALGMTFEEAIRALQRANTKARLQPQTKPAPPAAATSVAATAPSAAPVSPLAYAAPNPVVSAPARTPINVPQKLEPVLPAEELSTQQTAEEILSAARERIRQRAAAAKAERAVTAAASQPAATPPPPPEPAPAPEPVQQTKTLADAIGAAMTTSPAGAEPAAPPPQPATAEPQARSSWAPRAEPQSSLVARLPPPTRRPYAAPPLARPIQPNEGPPRPPLPLRPGQGPVAKFPPPRSPWPSPAGDPARGPRLPNGSVGGASHPPAEGLGPPPSLWPATPPQALRAGQGERGPLVENVPRVMRVGRPSPVEVHIPRDKIETLIMALSARGGAAFRPDGLVTRAVSVRLSAPNGGFWIEAESPETQWAESTSAKPHDEHAVWRWTVLPHRRGRNRLLLTVATRTVGRDGLASETAPPDRVIEIRVKSNKLRGFGRLLAWIVLVVIGTTVGYFMRTELTTALATLKKLIGV